MRILSREEFPEAWETSESEYYRNNPEKGLYLDKKLVSTEDIRLIDEEEAQNYQNGDDSSSSPS